jgi:hypothetical protein
MRRVQGGVRGDTAALSQSKAQIRSGTPQEGAPQTVTPRPSTLPAQGTPVLAFLEAHWSRVLRRRGFPFARLSSLGASGPWESSGQRGVEEARQRRWDKRADCQALREAHLPHHLRCLGW